MIAFATLLLGLVTGSQSIELLVGPQVAAVELLLDGESLGRLDAEPWVFEHDFGGRLVPHRLEAVALDAEGAELERTVQWVNLPRPSAEVSLVLELAPDGRGSRARLSWESLAATEPDRVAVTLDGAPLAVAQPADFALPAYDPRQLHFLRAEIEFGDNVAGLAEATFGGFYAEQVSTELMALPIAVEGRDPTLADLVDAFEVDGRALSPVALDRGEAEVVVVRDLRARESLVEMVRESGAVPSHFGRGTRTRFLWATATLRGDDTRYRLFPTSSELDLWRASLLGHLAHVRWPAGDAESQRLADAVAVAGLNVVRKNRRRAVVLVLGPREADRSQLDATSVRGYLEALRVPLFVWSPVAEEWAGGPWGAVEDISSVWKLDRATRAVRKELQRQRLIWFDGTYLPQEVALTGTVDGVEMVR